MKKTLSLILIATIFLSLISLQIQTVLADEDDDRDEERSGNNDEERDDDNSGRDRERTREEYRTRTNDGESEVRIEREERNGEVRERIKIRERKGEFEAESELEIESDNNRLRVRTRDGEVRTIRALPDRVATTAIQELGKEEIEIQIDERNSEVIYKAETRKRGRFLGIFRTEVRIEGEFDPDTGALVRKNKPWWAFMVSGEDDDQFEESNKVHICHIPPGNTEAKNTLEVGGPSLKAHLAHGDFVGECEDEGEIEDEDSDDFTRDVLDHFITEMQNAVNVQPIEGYMPTMFLEVFPKLLKEDFHNVEAQQGRYRFENDELTFEEVIEEGEAPHSAGRAITREGMSTLLKRISERTGIIVTGIEDVNEIIASISQETDSQIEFILTAENYKFVMEESSNSDITVKEGDTVQITLTNTEGTHDWTIDEFNAATNTINSGETTTIEFVASKKGTFEYYCSVGSHRELGMKGNLIVE